MKGFAQLQDDFQRAILDGDEGVLADILDSPKETRGVLFDVYRNAYALRLVEVMANENEALADYLGEEAFDAMARAYIAARPSRDPNLRWFSKGLPDFLADTDPYRARPELSEIAALEAALSDAFDAPDARVLTAADLAGIEPTDWRDLVFLPQPHVHRLDPTTNAFAIWSALVDEESAPEAQTLAELDRLLVWRQDVTPMVRDLSVEEAMLWDEACSGIPFGVLCELAATYDDPDNAAGRVAGTLKGWLDAELLTSFEIAARPG